MSVGDYQHRRKSLKTSRQARGPSQSQITRTITIRSLPFTAIGSLITPITFTHSLQSRKLWCTPRGHATTPLLRGVLRRVLKIAFEKVLRIEGVLQWALRSNLRRVLRRGSKKGLSRRPWEGRNTSFQEYGPLRVRPRDVFFFFFG